VIIFATGKYFRGQQLNILIREVEKNSFASILMVPLSQATLTFMQRR
jgi:hypothetical protein